MTDEVTELQDVVEAAEEITESTPLPVVAAHDLGLRTKRGWVFRDVTLAVHPGELVALAGPSGSGRTSLLLALAGRFTTTHGVLRLPAKPWRTTALGYVPGVHQPEPALTVAEHFAERRLLLGVKGIGATDRTLGRDLTPYQTHVLCLELARIARPRLIVVDDLDVALTPDEQADLWAVLRSHADEGTAVIATCREGVPGADQTVTLTKENR